MVRWELVWVPGFGAGGIGEERWNGENWRTRFGREEVGVCTDFSSSFHAEDFYAFDYCGAGVVDAV